MGGNSENNNTSFAGDDRRLDLLSLFEEESLEEILWQVAQATDLAVALADYRGDECTDCINYAEFCRFAREGEDPLCKVANATNAFGITQAAVLKKPFVYFCPYGLLMFAIPIIVDGEFIGGFVGGQVRCEDAPENTVHLKNVLPYKEDFLEDEIVREKFMQANEIPYDKYINMASLMESYFRLIAEKRSVNIAQTKLKRLEQKLEAERHKRVIAERTGNKYKLVSMRTQLNPSFIMNTMIALSNMAIIEKAEMTNELINQFAAFMGKLFRQNEDAVKMQDEADLIRSYLDIYKSWLGERIEYSLDIEDNTLMQKIPSLILFTLLEQYICFKMAVPDQKTKLSVHAWRSGDYVHIQIDDIGAAAHPVSESKKMIMQQIEEMQGISIRTGFQIVRERMEELFNKDFELKESVDTERMTYVCLIKMPHRFDREYI